MVRELQEMTHKQFNTIRKIKQEQNEMYNKEIENLKKYQTILELMNTITELKNSTRALTAD